MVADDTDIARRISAAAAAMSGKDQHHLPLVIKKTTNALFKGKVDVRKAGMGTARFAAEWAVIGVFLAALFNIYNPRRDPSAPANAAANSAPMVWCFFISIAVHGLVALVTSGTMQAYARWRFNTSNAFRQHASVHAEYMSIMQSSVRKKTFEFIPTTWFGLPRLRPLVANWVSSQSYLSSSLIRTAMWCCVWLAFTPYWRRDSGETPWDFSQIPATYYWLERIFLSAATIDFCFLYYVAHEKHRFLFRWATLIEIITLPPWIWLVSSQFFEDITGYHIEPTQYLLAFGYFRFFRLYGITPVLRKAFPHVSPSRIQVIAIVLAITSTLLVFAGLMWYLEGENSDSGPEFNSLFPDFFYFAIVTFSTVGYGDFSPTYNVSRIVAIIAIIVVVVWIPLETSTLIRLLVAPVTQIGSLPSVWERHDFILMVGKPIPDQVDVFLEEIFAFSDQVPKKAVLLTPNDPSQYVDQIGKAMDFFRIRLTVKKGDAGDGGGICDLREVRASDARAIFVLSNPWAMHLVEEDRRTIVRCLGLRKFVSMKRVSLQLNTDTAKSLALSFGCDQVLCFNELKVKVLAKSCTTCPGIIALLVNLGRTCEVAYRDPKDAPSMSDAERRFFEYAQGTRYELYRFDFPKCFHGESFQEVVMGLYECFGVLVIGIIKENSDNIYLNPLNGTSLDRLGSCNDPCIEADDHGIVIAQDPDQLKLLSGLPAVPWIVERAENVSKSTLSSATTNDGGKGRPPYGTAAPRANTSDSTTAPCTDSQLSMSTDALQQPQQQQQQDEGIQPRYHSNPLVLVRDDASGLVSPLHSFMRSSRRSSLAEAADTASPIDNGTGPSSSPLQVPRFPHRQPPQTQTHTLHPPPAGDTDEHEHADEARIDGMSPRQKQRPSRSPWRAKTVGFGSLRRRSPTRRRPDDDHPTTSEVIMRRGPAPGASATAEPLSPRGQGGRRSSPSPRRQFGGLRGRARDLLWWAGMQSDVMLPKGWGGRTENESGHEARPLVAFEGEREGEGDEGLADEDLTGDRILRHKTSLPMEAIVETVRGEHRRFTTPRRPPQQSPLDRPDASWWLQTRNIISAEGKAELDLVDENDEAVKEEQQPQRQGQEGDTDHDHEAPSIRDCEVHSLDEARQVWGNDKPFVLVCGWPRALSLLAQWVCRSSEFNVVVLTPLIPPPWSSFSSLAPFAKQIALIKGSPLRQSDLMRAGVVEAHSYVIFSARHDPDDRLSESDDQQDVDIILVCHKIQALLVSAAARQRAHFNWERFQIDHPHPSLPPKTTMAATAACDGHGGGRRGDGAMIKRRSDMIMISELHRTSNVRFLDASPWWPSDPAWIGRRDESTNQQFISYIDSPEYAAGRVFCDHMLYSLICQSRWVCDIACGPRVVDHLLGESTVKQSAIVSLTHSRGGLWLSSPETGISTVPVSKDLAGLAFGDALPLLLQRKLIPIGVYRAACDAVELPYVVCNPEPSFRLDGGDLIYVVLPCRPIHTAATATNRCTGV
ncbi:unnamed protein product [Vitrella brassicaformis CCMP3155]|uniref:Potassium channel domain-containing protein n=4 Tax=Vitrella brassicaformis TaxID=1169539 RepID=A0A0G4G3S2_VITBC|nr:unnamed protein product [Vitrella brassicaformis CCMP3155]|eukprot:CEM22711.1 unnamed protein product [Vitrella brassicaformis CCMP3155]